MKERNSEDALLDLKSQLAIVTCDKERLSHEKSDVSHEVEKMSKINMALNQVSARFQLVVSASDESGI